jgi:hypothetical protein
MEALDDVRKSSLISCEFFVEAVASVRGADKVGHWSGALCDRGGVKSSQW